MFSYVQNAARLMSLMFHFTYYIVCSFMFVTHFKLIWLGGNIIFFTHIFKLVKNFLKIIQIFIFWWVFNNTSFCDFLSFVFSAAYCSLCLVSSYALSALKVWCLLSVKIISENSSSPGMKNSDIEKFPLFLPGGSGDYFPEKN